MFVRKRKVQLPEQKLMRRERKSPVRCHAIEVTQTEVVCSQTQVERSGMEDRRSQIEVEGTGTDDERPQAEVEEQQTEDMCSRT